MKLETANVARSSRVFQDCRDPKVFPGSMGNSERKATKETQAFTVSLGSQDSREPRALLELLDPKE